MNLKYEFTGETMEHNGRTLRRIRAIKDFGSVSAGDLGGWLGRYVNLSHEGWCWVANEAKVYDFAVIKGNARIGGNAEIFSDARVFGNAAVYDWAKVYGVSWLHGSAIVCDHSEILGPSRIYGMTQISNNAWISTTRDYLSIWPIGSRNDCTTIFRDKEIGVRVNCGCFTGSLEEFERDVNNTHKYSQHGMEYRKLIELAKIRFAHVFDEIT